MKARTKTRETKPKQGAAEQANQNVPLVVAFGAQKGGVGKTTLALNLASALQRAGLLTTILDLDVQKSAERFAENRARVTGEEAPVVVHGTPDNLAGMVETARRAGVQAILIDCPGALDRSLVYASASATIVVVPTRSSLLDRDSLADTLKFLQAAGKIDKCLVVLNAALDGRDGGIAEVREVASRFGVRVANTQIADDRAFSVTLAKGMAVVEAAGRSKTAARSIEALLDEILAFQDAIKNSVERN